MKRIFALSLILLILGCSTSTEYKVENQIGFKRLNVIYNSNRNALIGNTIFVKNLGDVSIFLHEYAHALHDFHLKPSVKLVALLSKEYSVPPKIMPSYKNRELQDFITTTTRWKIKYPFKHNEDCLIVNELMANLFVIFTYNGEEKEYIKKHYNEIYIEYEKYYNALDKNKKE